MNSIAADALITLKEAAELAGRGYFWAYERAADGRFDAHKSKQGGRIYVSRASVARIIARERIQQRSRKNARRKQPTLRLVINNA